MARTTVRTTISVDVDLKARMDAIKDPPNWSLLACQAFLKWLDEFDSGDGNESGSDPRDGPKKTGSIRITIDISR